MSDWDFKFLEEWDSRINDLASEPGLDWYPIVYEVCDYYSNR